MKRFKRPISEVAKGFFHQGSGDSKPVIPNLGVNSKDAESSSPLNMNSPAKNRGGSSSTSMDGTTSGGRGGGGGTKKADPYAKAAKNDSKLGDYVKARKSLKKGSAEWNANQNKINKAYGVKKRYDETVKPATTTETTKATTTATEKVDTKKTKTEVAKTNLDTAKSTVKDAKASAKDTRKSARIQKRADKKTARAARIKKQGGTKVGNALRGIFKKKDKKKAE